MTQLNYNYDSKNNLEHYLLQNKVDLANNKILIQLFTSIEDIQNVKTLTQEILSIVPNATLIGASTAGEIYNGEMQERSSVLSISTFEKTSFKSFALKGDDSFDVGLKMANELRDENSKCIITFSDGLKLNGEKYLAGLSHLTDKDVIIAGGTAADLFKFETTFTILNGEVFSGGAVGISLSGEDLEAYSDYNLGWKAIGPQFTITKADGNRVYEIDNRNIIDVYRDVLGDDVADNIPASAIEFPLIKQVANTPVARSMITKLDDGSIIYAGSLKEGEKVQFGIGSATLVNVYNSSAEVKSHNFQSCYLYSCAARKQFLNKELEKTFKKIDAIVPTVGFFTYGEFLSNHNTNSFLNITTTLLFLNEKNTSSKKSESVDIKNGVNSSKLDNALFHLIDYITHDIAKKETQLNISNHKMQEYLSAIDSVLIVSKTDSKGIITYANERFEKISGYSKEELIGKSHNIVRDPSVQKETYQDLWSTVKKGKIWTGEFPNRRKDGSIYYVKSSIIPLVDGKGAIVEYMAIREDITSLVNSKLAVEEQSRYANMILENEENIVAVVVNEKLNTINASFFKSFDYANFEDFKKKHECICELFIEKDNYLKSSQGSELWYTKVLQEADKTHLALIKNKNSQNRIYKVTAREFTYNNNTYLIATLNDITEIEIAKEQALKAEAAQAMFLANMSHEIRTPMNGILGFAELLSTTELNDLQNKYINIINSSTKTLLNIINDILDFSKISNQNVVLETIETNMFVELTSVFELLKSLADKKSIEYINKLDSNMLECATTDSTRLKQIITNLISNAIKFTPEYGRVTLQTEVIQKHKNSQTVRISVEDNGIGISLEKQSKIFEAFSQADDSTTRRFGGTGLGLSISSDLVELFGGELKITSQEAKGSKFYFDIELQKCANSTILKDMLSQHEIIIVKSNKSNMQLIQNSLNSFHVEYKIVEDSSNFKDILTSNTLIITFENSIAMKLIELLSKEQIICIANEDTQNINCIDILIDESFASNLYNFLLSRMKNGHVDYKDVPYTNTPSLNILVAEDYEINRMLIESIFQQYKNIKLTFAYNGKEAVNKVLKTKYDLIFMDVNMPVMNGIDATKEIRNRLDYHIPIIALTANSLEGDKEKFLSAGMDEYISKPLELKKLEQVLYKYSNKIEKNTLQESKLETSIDFPLDIESLINNIFSTLGLNREVATKLLIAFNKSLQESIKELEDALKTKNEQKILDITHKIKGSSSSLALIEVNKFFEKIEEDINNKDFKSYNNELEAIKSYSYLLDKGLSDDS